MGHGARALLTIVLGALIGTGGALLFARGLLAEPGEGSETLAYVGFYALLFGAVVLLTGAIYLIAAGVMAARRRSKR
jgi:hypothetical protein